MKLVDLLPRTTRSPARHHVRRRNIRRPYVELLEGRTLLSYGYGWTQAVGAPGYDNAYAVVTDSTGNVYMTGGFEGTVDFQPRDPSTATDTLTSHLESTDPSGATHGQDIFLAKYDPSGGLLWVRDIGGTGGAIQGSEVGQGLAVDSLGNVYVTGCTNSTTIDIGTMTLATPNHGFRAKLDANGAVLWAKDVYGRGGFQKIDVDASGNVYTLGDFQGTVNFDVLNPSTALNTLTAGNASGEDVYLTKNAPDGTFLWAEQISYPSAGAGLGLDVAGGAILLTGRFAGTVDFDPGPATHNLTTGTTDTAFVLKLDLNGAYQWAFALPSSRYQASIGRDVAMDDVGNVYTTGFFTGTVDFDPGKGRTLLTSQGGDDAYVAKYTASGAFVWARDLGGTATDLAYSLTLDAAWNVTTIGTFTGTADFDPGSGTAYRTAVGLFDVYVSKLDTNGNYLGVATFGGSGGDWGESVAVDGSGNTYAAGFFRSTTVDFDPTAGVDLKTNANPNNATNPTDDIFLTKLTWSSTVTALQVASAPTTRYDIALPASPIYLGNGAQAQVSGMVGDASDNDFATGTTYSSDLLMKIASRTKKGGNSHAFVTKVSAD